MIGMFCVSVPANIDVILVKHFFNAGTAGLFIAATVLGKIIIFGSTAVGLTTFPKISKLYAEKKDTKGLLNSSLIYTGLLSGFAAIVFWIFPYQIISIAYGMEYLEALKILQWYGVSMFFFSLTVVLIRYSLAVQDLKFSLLPLSFTVIEIILWCICNSRIFDMVIILFSINLIMFITCYAYIYLKEKNYFYNSKSSLCD